MPDIKRRADITYRVQYGFWKDPAKFDELLSKFVELRDSFDEIVLHSAYTHAVRSLQVIADDMPEFNLAVGKCHSAGFKCGLNLLATFGHHGEDFRAIPENLVQLHDMNGNLCSGTVCHNVPENWEKYLTPMLQMYAATDIDFYWLDDDRRMCGHGNIGLVCFCDHCMELFNQQNGCDLTRAQLRDRFDRGSAEERFFWRKKWLDFSGWSLVESNKKAAQVIRQIVPDMEIGIMDAGMRPGDAASYADLAASVAGSDYKYPIRWRPGGGAYTDEKFDEVLNKALICGCTSAMLPDQVNNIQAEIENFNYRRLAKSERSIKLEASASVAAGLTGCAWNVSCTSDPLLTYVPLMDSLAGHRRFLDLQAQWSRIRPRGVWQVWKPGILAAYGLNYAESFPWQDTPGSIFHAVNRGILSRVGLPVAFRQEEALITVLTPESVWMLSDDELKKVFSGGVYVTAEALILLEKRNFGSFTGFTIDGVTTIDAQEELLEHRINAGCTGYLRNCYQSFWRNSKNNDGKAWHLKALDDKAETLARLVNYAGEILADCSMGIYENALGGRVAVAGYYPLDQLDFQTKITSMKNLFSWLAGNKISFVSSYHRIAVWDRDVHGIGSVVQFTNMYADPAENVEIFIHNGCEKMVVVDEELNSNIICGTVENNGSRYTIPVIPPWHTVLIKPV